MRILGLLIAIAFTLASPVGVRAASTNAGQNIFALAATFQDGTRIAGTITVDEQSGRIINANVKTSGDNAVEFSRIADQESLGYAYVFRLIPSNAPYPTVIIGERGSPQTLVGYPGGAMGPKSDIYFGDGSSTVILSGTFKLISGQKTQL